MVDEWLWPYGVQINRNENNKCFSIRSNSRPCNHCIGVVHSFQHHYHETFYLVIIIYRAMSDAEFCVKIN